MDTVWVLGDQLNRDVGALKGADPAASRVLLVTSDAKLGSLRWHRQRLHLVLTAMRRFAAELRDRGFEVDERRAPTMAAGLAAHRDRFGPDRVVAMEPMNRCGHALLERLGVELVDNDQFLCHYRDFATWAAEHERADGSLRMEDFYRWQRRRLGYLMDGDEPAGGRWNLDADNRERPGTDVAPPRRPTSRLDELDRDVLAHLPDGVWGAAPDGTWATSRRRALVRLRTFVDEALPRFGALQDAMIAGQWQMHHSLLSHALNLGMLHPAEVCDAVEDAYRSGAAPLNAAEGFIRQIIGWREFVWGVYWLWTPAYRDVNELAAHRDLPPVLAGDADTSMRCVADTMRSIDDHAYAHHIQRLMVLANLVTLAGVRPQQVVEWMGATFVDGSEWVMLPNVLGMGTYADGGRMSTKPYVSSGAYIDRMSRGYCSDCRYDRTARVGDDACPFTTLYWDFLARHRARLGSNHRVARQYATLDRLDDLDAVRARAAEVLDRLDGGLL